MDNEIPFTYTLAYGGVGIQILMYSLVLPQLYYLSRASSSGGAKLMALKCQAQAISADVANTVDLSSIKIKGSVTKVCFRLLLLELRDRSLTITLPIITRHHGSNL